MLLRLKVSALFSSNPLVSCGTEQPLSSSSMWRKTSEAVPTLVTIRNGCADSLLTDRYHHELHAIEVFDLATSAMRLSVFVDRHIHIAAEGPLK